MSRESALARITARQDKLMKRLYRTVAELARLDKQIRRLNRRATIERDAPRPFDDPVSDIGRDPYRKIKTAGIEGEYVMD